MKREDAELVHEQMKMLLEDERSFGDKLVNDRKIKLSLVALVVGFGFFKLQSATELVELLSDAGIHDVWIWIGIVIISVLILVTLYLLVLERNPKSIENLLGTITKDLRSQNSESTAAETKSGDMNPKQLFGAALVVLHPDDSLIESIANDGYPEIADRVVDLSTAYVRLALANRRVRRRLEYGTFSLILVFVCVIILSGVAVGVSMSPVENLGTLQHCDQRSNCNDCKCEQISS
ncbi:MAG: hypothetical protein CMJ35_14970 [Phycisphaerae bacterium]|nr:hypothetical protein [Phycisphaerae bacterium]|tara:strand:- start:603 stop:1307 length:705 start_codon:yes stop_codon:yes gene_type:complete